jgi:hypothetical protein
MNAKVATIITCLSFAVGLLAQPLADPKVPEIETQVDLANANPTPQDVTELNGIAAKAKDTGKAYYPTIVDLIGAGDHKQTKKVVIRFTYGYDGVAATSGDHMDVSNSYALKHPDDIPGVIVHEMTHVVQNYTHGDNPGWLVEGIADYVRWFHFEPLSKRPHPHASRADARGSYQTTAAFLFWAVNKYDRDLVKKLNEQMYQGKYSEDDWKTYTGKSLDDLNAEWKSSLSG